ncbi:ATP-NAD/AcoX kinase [Coriobacterium glomerans PW2]|uniref:NAD kinase n=1 Tax=Coriobacterium glomerans (strain ATCC 49209 / DSM 20642 / JCM 10262 / PW2) TaxID=700015 RepID=F2N7Y9_CORGP|nr:NAD(+)/NADH kinase [Coriobacterium glomerans]AEB07098.1 ATP-NAD/AcoX kinase [Coriobacterium glomerans PW2]
MKILLVPNYFNDEATRSGLALELWLNRQGYEVSWVPDQRDAAFAPADVEGCDLVISLGGDGTLLRAARIVNYREIPILGLSYGHVGFLTAASPKDRDVLAVVEDALAGELHVSRRATLACDVVSVRDDGGIDTVHTFALNDLALARGPLSDMVEFAITVSGHHIDRLRGDGVVISTATGSTGYALSAGGPIVSPDYTGMVCVPIAPHTIQARAFLTSPSDIVEIAMSKERPTVPAIAIDGQFVTADGTVDHVSVRRGPGDILLLDYGPESFYNSVSRVFFGVNNAR